MKLRVFVHQEEPGGTIYCAGADAGAGVWYEGAADFLSYRFLSHPDNPEGNDAA